MRVTLTFGAFAQRAFALALFLLGLIAAIYGWDYGLGRINEIGPGAFPLGLGLIMMILAGIAFVTAAAEDTAAKRRLKSMMLIPAGVAAWALLIEGGGLLIANAALVAFMFLSEDDLKIRSGVLLTIFLTVGGYVVLVLGFHLPLHIVGNWL